MQTMSYIHSDVPAGMELRAWRRTAERKQRRRMRIHRPRRRH